MEERLQSLEEILLLKDQVKKMTESFKECSSTLFEEIEDLRHRVNMAEVNTADDIDALNDNLSRDIENLDNRIDDVSGEITDAEDQARENTSMIDDLESKINNLESKIDEIDSHMSDMLALME